MLAKVTWLAGASAYLMARVCDRSTAPLTRGTPFVQADVASLALSVFDITDPANPNTIMGLNASALTVADVIFDELQPWDRDGVGFNFGYQLPSTAFPTSGAIYRVEVKWTLSDGRIGFVRWEGPAETVYSE